MLKQKFKLIFSLRPGLGREVLTIFSSYMFDRVLNATLSFGIFQHVHVPLDNQRYIEFCISNSNDFFIAMFLPK